MILACEGDGWPEIPEGKVWMCHNDSAKLVSVRRPMEEVSE